MVDWKNGKELKDLLYSYIDDVITQLDGKEKAQLMKLEISKYYDGDFTCLFRNRLDVFLYELIKQYLPEESED